MGRPVPKQYIEIRGKPILLRAVRPFLDHPAIGAVVVVLPTADSEDPPDWLRTTGAMIVAGGAERGDSVWNGLLAAPDGADPLLIHDGARPFVSAAVIDRVLNAAGEGGAAAGLPLTDTIKEVGADGRICGTPDRARFWQAQTPQGFRRKVIFEAHRQARALGITATDDAALCERLGLSVIMVEGAAENIKITRPADLLIAEALASRASGW